MHNTPHTEISKERMRVAAKIMWQRHRDNPSFVPNRRGKNMPEASKKMISETMRRLKIVPKVYPSGKDHWAWKGGVSNKNHVQRGVFWETLGKRILERDNYTCQKCGSRGVYLHVHHIKYWSDYPELRFNEENCITLCRRCHYLIHFNNNISNKKILTWGGSKYPVNHL